MKKYFLLSILVIIINISNAQPLSDPSCKVLDPNDCETICKPCEINHFPDPVPWATALSDPINFPFQIQADIPYHGIDGSNGYAKANSSCDSHLASLNVLIL
jgi:hypothetical protein